MVVVGEQTALTVWLENVTIIDWPDSPRAAPLVLKREAQKRFNINGRIREGFRYMVSAFEPGVYRIPPFEIKTSTGILRSKAHLLRVFPISDLATQGIKIGSSVTPYLTGVFLAKPTPYLGETQDVEAKLYLAHESPNLLRLSDGNVIQMKKDGLAAWRFTTNAGATGYLDYDGHRFHVYTYRSSINALQEGPLSLGPGDADAIFQRRMMVRGGFATGSHTAKIHFPKVDLDIRPLPDGAPPEFQGAVGSFTMEVRPLGQEIEFGNPLTIEVSVTGSGNIDQFPGPQLVDPEKEWKQFDMIAKPSGGERRSSSGSAEYSQVIRPTVKVPTLPPYRFAYFDPLLKAYRTLASPSIPITITGEPPAADSGSVELAFLTPNGPFKSRAASPGISRWLWQAIPAVLVIALLAMGFRRRLWARKMSGQPTREFHLDLEKVGAQSSDRVSFYREATRFLTERQTSEGFEDIFKTRDEICFRQDPVPEPVQKGEKKRVIDLLKTLSPLWLVGLFFGFLLQSVEALSPDPTKAKAEILLLMEQEPAREHFYNLALSEKALGNPGSAALWAYRFQLYGGDSGDLMESLPGIHTKAPEGTEWVSVIPKWVYLQVAIAGVWATLILFLVLKLVYGKLRGPFLLGASSLASLGILIGLGGWYLYPLGISFEPLQTLSVITEDTPMRSQPFEGDNAMRDTLIGSLCKVTKTRAGWAYVILPGGLNGWVRGESVMPVREP